MSAVLPEEIFKHILNEDMESIRRFIEGLDQQSQGIAEIMLPGLASILENRYPSQEFLNQYTSAVLEHLMERDSRGINKALVKTMGLACGYGNEMIAGWCFDYFRDREGELIFCKEFARSDLARYCLQNAILGKQKNMVEWLLSKGADLNEQDIWSAALRKDAWGMLPLLLERGADMKAVKSDVYSGAGLITWVTTIKRDYKVGECPPLHPGLAFLLSLEEDKKSLADAIERAIDFAASMGRSDLAVPFGAILAEQEAALLIDAVPVAAAGSRARARLRI